MTKEFDEWMEGRDEAMRTLDTRVLTNKGASYEVALCALHKARYECTRIEPELRRESRKWLENNGYHRLFGLPWPSNDELPNETD